MPRVFTSCMHPCEMPKTNALSHPASVSTFSTTMRTKRRAVCDSAYSRWEAPVRQIGAEFNLSSTRTREMRPILVNGKMTVHHVDERLWKCAIRLLSGSKIRDKTVFHTLPRNTTNPQVRSGVSEKSAHHFTSLENAPFRIICSGICSTPGAPTAVPGARKEIKR